MKRILQRRDPAPTRKPVSESRRSRLVPLLRKATGVWGTLWSFVPRSSSRRMGSGTHGRTTDPKQGRSRGQPKSGRRAKTCRITRDPGKSAGVFETGGSGCSSVDARDNTTLAEQRTRGSRRLLERPEAWSADNADRRTAGRHEGDEGDIKPVELRAYADLTLEPVVHLGRVSLTDRRLGLKPYWGKPNVRNFREGGGNVSYGRNRIPLHNRKGEDRSLPTYGCARLGSTRQ